MLNQITKIPLIFLVAAGALLSGCRAGGEQEAGKRTQRIILISIDTLRADFLGAYNPKIKTTPNLDHFASENILCTNVTSQAPSTAISHKSILYSLYPGIHKMSKTSVPEEKLKSPLEILQSRGFKTAAFVGGGQLSSRFGFGKGFDLYWEAIGKKRTNEEKSNLKETESRVNDWLNQNYKEKFFLFVHTYQVHCPYDPPKEYKDRFAGWYRGEIDPKGKCGDTYYNNRTMSAEDYRYVRDLYAAQVSYVDAFLGRLFQHLRELGIYDTTMIVFLSDHGESLGERSYVGHNQLYGIQLRIPLVLHIPGIQAVRIDAPLQAIDALPTVFDVLGFGRPFPFEGRSLLPVLLGKERLPADRLLISEQKDRIRVRKGDRVAIFSRDGGQPAEVYNLQNDHEEMKNLAEDDPKIISQSKLAYFKILNDSRDVSAKFIVSKTSQPELDEEVQDQLKALGYVQE